MTRMTGHFCAPGHLVSDLIILQQLAPQRCTRKTSRVDVNVNKD